MRDEQSAARPCGACAEQLAQAKALSRTGAGPTIEGVELYRAIYCSRVARQVRLADVEEIVARAAPRNAAKGITGLLVYTPSCFLQVLEGEESAVEETLARIRCDQRHHDVRILAQARVTERMFDGWAMVARQFHALSDQELQQLDAESALHLLERVSG